MKPHIVILSVFAFALGILWTIKPESVLPKELRTKRGIMAMRIMGIILDILLALLIFCAIMATIESQK